MNLRGWLLFLLHVSVATPEADIALLQSQVAELNEAVVQLQRDMATLKQCDESSSSSHQPTPTTGAGFPLHYKIKPMTSMQRAATGSMTSYLLQKFTIFAGDRKLGVIGERSLMKKLIRDHVSMSDNSGKVVADFDENILRSWRPSYWGCQSFNLYDNEANGRRILSGIQESYWTSWWRGERQGFEFTSTDGVQYVSRKVHTVTEGMNKWVIVEALTGTKVAEMEESVVAAAGGAVSSGWLVNVERGVTLDPRVPGFFAAYELTERTTTYLDCVQGVVHIAVLGAAVAAALFAIAVAVAPGLARRLLRRGRAADPGVGEDEAGDEGEDEDGAENEDEDEGEGE